MTTTPETDKFLAEHGSENLPDLCRKFESQRDAALVEIERLRNDLAAAQQEIERLLDEITALTHEGRRGELEQANVGLAAENERLRRLLEGARALLEEWLATEIDEMDEEFEEWVEGFTIETTSLIERIDAALAREPSPK